MGYDTKKIPRKLKKYFWDCDFESLDWDTYSFFLAERILNYGNVESVKWLLSVGGKKFVISVAKKSRCLEKKTKNFWMNVYGK